MNNLFKKVFTVSVVVTTIFWSMGLAALVAVPVATAATLTDGDLIKGTSSAVYYYMSGKKYVFTSEAVYKTWFSDFKNVKTLTADEMSALTIGGNVAIKAGTKLVQFVSVNDNGSFVASDPKVYAVSPSGVLHQLDSATRAATLYGSAWEKKIQPIVDGYFVNYSVGSAISSDVHPDGSLVKYAGSDNNYVIEGGKKRLVASGDAFTANGFKASDVVTTTITYSDGANLTGAESLYTNAAQTGTVTVVTPTTGGLTVALSSVTPAASTVPANATVAAADYVMTKVNFTAGSSDVTVTSVKVTRSGLGNDAAFSAIKLFDGTLQLGTSQSLGSSHQATFSGLSFVISAGQTKVLSLAGTFAQVATYSGNILNLGINAAGDVTTTAAVAGTFPVTGNGVTLTSSVTIGTANLYNGSMGTRNATDLTLDPTDKDVRLTQVKISAGSAEGLVLDQIVAVKNGTAAATDVKNIRLVNDSTSKTLATVDTLNSNGRAVFDNLGATIKKGEYAEFSVLADMNGGSGRTIAFDLHDGTAYTIKVHGDVYGYGITPARSDFCATAGTCTAQTINQGYITVSKSPKTPSTGTISLGGTGVTLAAFDYAAYGEPINITSTQITLTPASSGYANDYTNVTIYDENGGIVAGPKDYDETTINTADTLTFTDAYTVPVGVHTYYVKSNIATDAVGTAYVTMPVNTLVGKGANSGKTTYTTSSGSTVAPSAAVSCNTMTIQSPALVATTLATPVADNFVVNAQDQDFGYLQLSAAASAEDVKVTTLTFKDTTTSHASSYTDLINLEFWGDADNTDTDATAKKIETTNSTANLTYSSNTVSTVAFTFKTPLRIKKGTAPTFTLKVDVASGAGSGRTHTLHVDGTTGTVTSSGWSTGTAITETYSGSGQAQTIQASGLLKVNVSADRTAAAQYVGGTTGNSMMGYKLQSVYEPIDVTTLYVATTGSTANADIAKVKLYVDGKQIGVTDGYSLNAGGDAIVVLDSGTLVVPKTPSYSTLTIKVDLADKNSLTDAATLEIGLGAGATYDDTEWGANGAASTANSCTGGASDDYCYYYMTATGKNSGVSITTSTINSTGANSTGTVAASYVEYLYDGVLVASLDESSPSGYQTAASNKEVMKLKLTAVGDDITVDELEFCVAGTATSVTGAGDMTIKSSDLGTTYATLTNAAFNTYWDAVIADATYYIMDPGVSNGSCMSFGRTGATGVSVGTSATNNIVAFSSTITVSTTTPTVLRVFGDTTGAATNQTLQLTLSQNSASANKATVAGLTWENNSANVVNSALTKNLPVSGGSLSY